MGSSLKAPPCVSQFKAFAPRRELERLSCGSSCGADGAPGQGQPPSLGREALFGLCDGAASLLSLPPASSALPDHKPSRPRWSSSGSAAVENPDSDTSRGRGCGRQGRSVVAGGQAAGRPLRGTVCRLPAKLNVLVPHDPVIPLLGAPTGAESCRLHGDPHTTSPEAALTVAQSRKQPRCSSGSMGEDPVTPDSGGRFSVKSVKP